MTHATNGNGNPRQNQNQNFRPRLFAISPVTTGKKNGSAIIGKAIKNSINLILNYLENKGMKPSTCLPALVAVLRLRKTQQVEGSIRMLCSN
jgi:hypothetical protein